MNDFQVTPLQAETTNKMKTLQDTERRSESKNKRVIGRGLKEVSLVLLGRAENDSAQVSVDC